MLTHSLRKFSSGWTGKDYHSILGIKYGASPKEIKAAYLKQAKKYHPDSPTGDTEKFKIVAQAYEALNDPRNKQAAQTKQKQDTRHQNKDSYEDQNWKYEDEERTYREWRENRSWNQSSRESKFDSQGYEYYDPYTRQGERYTYSQFKKDRYNKVYKEPPRKTPNPTPENSENTSLGTFLFGVLTLCFYTAIKT